MKEMRERVRNYIEQEGMIRPGDRVVAGVSGGADSLCLFLLLQELAEELDFDLHVVHVHHGLRLSAGEDLRFVEELCRRLQVPCTVFRVDAAARAREWGTGVEEAGRRLRYDAFRQVCARLEQDKAGRQDDKENREDHKEGQGNRERHRDEENRQKKSRCRIAVAHHREDRAETVLFHLCRGTDLRGARGMLPVNGQIIRPLLRESRAAIEDYLTDRGFSWQEDETNADTGYTRNYIRREILPRLEEGVHAGATWRISQFAEACTEAESYLAAATDRALQRCAGACTSGEKLLLPEGAACTGILRLDALGREDPYLQGRILYRCLADSTVSGKDVGAVHVNALRRLCGGETDGQLSMPSRVTVFRRGGKIFFCRETGAEIELVPAEEKTYPLSEKDYFCRILDFQGCMSAIPGNEYTKWFDYDKIGTFPVFRTRLPGDRMHLFSEAEKPRDTGSVKGPGSSDPREEEPGEKKARRLIGKKIARIMLDGKVPAGIRDRMVLPFCGNEALWIPGLRMGDSFRVTPSTARVLEIRWERGGSRIESEETESERGEQNGIQY